ncbi:MAG: hypothetical protein ACUVQ0_04715 [Thermoproteota archaeon]
MGIKVYIFAAVSMVLIATVFSIWCFQPRTTVLEEGFEEGFGEWVAGADVPLDPNNPGQTVEWSITQVKNISKSGQYSLKLFIDGRQDDGTIWIKRKINVRKNAQVKAKVSFEFYSESESFNTIAVVCSYIGLKEPLIEEDFTILGPANILEGWKSYTHVVNVDTDQNGEIWVAIGISVRWETLMTYYIDKVKIVLE